MPVLRVSAWQGSGRSLAAMHLLEICLLSEISCIWGKG